MSKLAAFSPESFGKYYLVDKVAVGGMAEIFKAKTYSHGGFENLLVIKRILAHLGENEDFVKMFIDEAKVTVSLQHPNVVRIFDFGKIVENYFIAMEYVRGKDVRNVLSKLAHHKRHIPLEFVVLIAHEAAKGLHYAHTKTDSEGSALGIVHRDITPSNLLVSYEGAIKVADFGIAKAEGNISETRAGILKGKFQYMSPEQVAGEQLNGQSDVFSLGIVLWEMSTGHRLFKTSSDVKTLQMIKTCDFDDPSVVNPRVPDALERIIIRCLDPDRARRYQTADEVRQDLADFLSPRTIDAVQKDLSTFMQQLFGEEMRQEKLRLDHGSAIAIKMHEDDPIDWDDRTLALSDDKRALWPWLAAMVPILMLLPLLLGTLGLLLWVVITPDDVEDVAQFGTLDIRVSPTAKLTLDGESRGENTRFLIEDLAPGEHRVQLSAAGYADWDFPVDVTAGQKAQQPIQLLKLDAKPAEPAKPSGSTAPVGPPPTVSFSSTPSGAEVFANGNKIGRTPFNWTRGRAGRKYAIEYRLDGHQTQTGELNGLRASAAKAFSLTLKPKATVPGTLTVVVVGVGWANVHIDGKKISKPAPLRGYSLPSGKHTVRVENQAVGLDYTESIVVQGGAVSTVRATP